MTTRRRDIDLEEALEVVRDLLERHQRKHGYVPENVVVVGGTALAVHGVRERSLDVDVYIPDADDDIVAQSEEDGVLKYGPDFKLDVTPVDTLWGTLSIRDIDKSPIARRVSVGDRQVDIRTLDPETLYLLKSLVGRDKDVADLALLANVTTADAIIDRCNQTLPWFGDRSRIPEYLERLTSSLAHNFGTDLGAVMARIQMPDVVRRKIEQMRKVQDVRSGLLLRAAIMPVVDSIRPNSDDPSQLVFDSSGVSEKVAEIVATRPDLVTAVGRAVLKEQLPDRWAAWQAQLSGAKCTRP